MNRDSDGLRGQRGAERGAAVAADARAAVAAAARHRAEARYRGRGFLPERPAPPAFNLCWVIAGPHAPPREEGHRSGPAALHLPLTEGPFFHTFLHTEAGARARHKKEVMPPLQRQIGRMYILFFSPFLFFSCWSSCPASLLPPQRENTTPRERAHLGPVWRCRAASNSRARFATKTRRRPRGRDPDRHGLHLHLFPCARRLPRLPRPISSVASSVGRRGSHGDS